jgi:hypothetical protein
MPPGGLVAACPIPRLRLISAVEVHPSLDGEDVEVWRTEGHLEASARFAAGVEAWLRVTRVSGAPLGSVPLAIVPFEQQVPGEWHAAALLSDGELDSELVVEVTPAPTELPLPRRLEAVRRAATFGREAIRAQKAYDDARARRLWELCSEAWADAGDDERAAAAADRATEFDRPVGVGTPQGRTRPPLGRTRPVRRRDVQSRRALVEQLRRQRRSGRSPKS